MAQALGLPVAQLFTDELVLAELRISEETLERVREHGARAAQEVVEGFVPALVARLLAEATRTPVSLEPGARPKQRRTRAQVLAGTAQANAMRAAKRAQRQAQSRIDAPGGEGPARETA